ncbi:MAG: hypothetical protein WCO69_02455 [Candidatus Omnitrophota bacterium]
MFNIRMSFCRVMAGFLLVPVLALSLAGCSTFRRKFVRHSKSKDVKEDFIPVLEPVEYQRVEVSPVENYRSHYAMVKAYFGDVYAALDSRDPGEKRERYLLGQIAAHLQGMASLLTEARKLQAQKAAAEIDEAAGVLDKPAGIRRYDLLKGRVHQIEVDVRRALKPDMVKEFIVSP